MLGFGNSIFATVGILVCMYGMYLLDVEDGCGWW